MAMTGDRRRPRMVLPSSWAVLVCLVVSTVRYYWSPVAACCSMRKDVGPSGSAFLTPPARWHGVGGRFSGITRLPRLPAPLQILAELTDKWDDRMGSRRVGYLDYLVYLASCQAPAHPSSPLCSLLITGWTRLGCILYSV
jgi:hypothetical protein